MSDESSQNVKLNSENKLSKSVWPARCIDRALLHPGHRWFGHLDSPSYSSCSSKPRGDRLDDDDDNHDDDGDDDDNDNNDNDNNDDASKFQQRMLQLTVTGANVGTALAAKSNLSPSLSNPNSSQNHKILFKEL